MPSMLSLSRVKGPVFVSVTPASDADCAKFDSAFADVANAAAFSETAFFSLSLISFRIWIRRTLISRLPEVAFVRSSSWDDESMLLFLKSYYEQALFLRHKHSETSNWLTFEMAGLFAAGILFPELKAAAEWRQHAAYVGIFVRVHLAEIRGGRVNDDQGESLLLEQGGQSLHVTIQGEQPFRVVVNHGFKDRDLAGVSAERIHARPDRVGHAILCRQHQDLSLWRHAAIRPRQPA